MLLERCCTEGWSVTYNYSRVQAEAAEVSLRTNAAITSIHRRNLDRCRWAPSPFPAQPPPQRGQS